MPPLLATLGAKIVAAVAVVVLAFSFGLYEGCAITKQAWDASEKKRSDEIAKQATKAAENVIKQGENTARAIRQYIHAKIEAEAQAAAVQKELDDYVQTHPDGCKVSAEFERVFDTASGVLPPAARPDPVPPATSSPSGTDGEKEARATTTEVLQAYADVTGELWKLWDDYAFAIDWMKTSYELQKAGAGR